MFLAGIFYERSGINSMIDTTDIKRELEELTHRLGKTQEYL